MFTQAYRVAWRASIWLRFDALCFVLRYSKWKAKLKYLGSSVTFYKGIVIHGPEYVSIGANSAIADYVHIWGGGGVEIGENVLVAAHCTITSVTHNSNAPLFRDTFVTARVVIENNVWIGSNAAILPGVRIGNNSIVGAGAVVIRDVPPNSVVAGVPAKEISRRSGV